MLAKIDKDSAYFSGEELEKIKQDTIKAQELLNTHLPELDWCLNLKFFSSEIYVEGTHASKFFHCCTSKTAISILQDVKLIISWFENPYCWDREPANGKGGYSNHVAYISDGQITWKELHSPTDNGEVGYARYDKGDSKELKKVMALISKLPKATYENKIKFLNNIDKYHYEHFYHDKAILARYKIFNSVIAD